MKVLEQKPTTYSCTTEKQPKAPNVYHGQIAKKTTLSKAKNQTSPAISGSQDAFALFFSAIPFPMSCSKPTWKSAGNSHRLCFLWLSKVDFSRGCQGISLFLCSLAFAKRTVLAGPDVKRETTRGGSLSTKT